MNPTFQLILFQSHLFIYVFYFSPPTSQTGLEQITRPTRDRKYNVRNISFLKKHSNHSNCVCVLVCSCMRVCVQFKSNRLSTVDIGLDNQLAVSVCYIPMWIDGISVGETR